MEQRTASRPTEKATLTPQPQSIHDRASAVPNGANVATATIGACTLVGNLGLGNANYAAGLADYTSGLNGLLGELGPVPRKGQATIFFPKIDWLISTKHHATVEVNRTRWTSPAGIQTQASNTFGIASFGNDYVRDTWGVAKLYSTLTSTLSNEARFQYGRDFEFEFAQPPTAYERANFVTSRMHRVTPMPWAFLPTSSSPML